MFKSMISSMILLIIITICASSCGTKTTISAKTEIPDNKTDNYVKVQPEKVIAEPRIIEPDSLISKEGAEKLINKPVAEAKKTENQVVGQKICFYDAGDDGAANFLQVSLSQNAFMSETMLDAGQDAKAIYETIKNNFKDRVEVDGIGEDAFIAPPGIHILKGDYYICIGVGNSDDEGNREILKEAGKKAIENLEKTLE